jgi:hypothetical protein
MVRLTEVGDFICRVMDDALRRQRLPEPKDALADHQGSENFGSLGIRMIQATC